MKHLAILTTIAALALAAAAAPAAAQAPREKVDDDDISTLNGQLVKVGDQNRYRYSYKKYNVSTNPLGIIMGSYGLSGSYAFSDNIAVRGDLNYYAPVGGDVEGVEVGVGAPIYFRKMYSGLFVEPGLIVKAIGSEYASETNVVLGPQTLIGYHWYWDSGLNVSVAAGVGRNWNTSNDTHYPDDELFFNGYLRFGYAF